MIKHQSTTAFGQVNALPRLVYSQSKTLGDTLVANIEAEKEVHRVLDDAIEAIKKAAETDNTLSRVRCYLSNKWLNKRLERESLHFLRRRDSQIVYFVRMLWSLKDLSD